MKPFLSSLFFLLLAVSSLKLTAQPVDAVIEGVSLNRLTHQKAFVDAQLESGTLPGAVTLVYRNGQTVYLAAQGHRNVAEETPMTTDAIFYIQSMTKPIITVAFMMLYEEGHFQLTDPVSRYLPRFADLRVVKNMDDGIHGETEPLASEITIAQLLSHTAGFTHGISGNRFDQEFGQRFWGIDYPDISTRLDSFLNVPLIGQPGEQWFYSFAPDVLSVLIEHFSGMSTDDFLQSRIFDPLEMEDTGYNLNEEQQKRVVQLHFVDENGDLALAPRQERTNGNKVWSGVNALFSTAEDYLKFCQMLLQGGSYNGHQLLSPKTIELMTLNHVGDLYGAPGWGFGLGFAVINNLADTKLLGSEGLYRWSGAYNTHFFIDPQEQLIAVFMTQTAPYSDYYQQKLRQMVYQSLVD